MDFLPNVSFNSLVVPPTIQRVKLEKCKNKLKMMSIKCDVKCDYIVHGFIFVSKIVRSCFKS
jgi:hypothetical protein